MNKEGQTEFAMRSRVARTSSDYAVNVSITGYLTLSRSVPYRFSYFIFDMIVLHFNRFLSILLRNIITRGSVVHQLYSVLDMDDRSRLLNNQDHSRDPSVEDILHKTDVNIAQVRETLPEDGIPGSFHFVDARPPDSGCSVWALLIGVVFMFMVVPLLLTFYEEYDNEEQS
uniref:LEM domain-containing protein n=1 Tax=Heterorhabditis bacteriophora TaxID=37862 RepID=A0A1I7WHM8_HETBA